MTDNNKREGLVFKTVAVCKTPMEAEIFPATLREHEIPHRTEWIPTGALNIMVPEEWEAEARETLEKASGVFFGEKLADATDGPAKLDEDPSRQLPSQQIEPSAEPQASQPQQDPTLETEQAEDPARPRYRTAEDEAAEEGLALGAMFGRDGLPSPDELRIRTVWPAWALAALPGTGLGHLYAGKFQMFLYLAFLSVIGILFFQFTQSYLAFLLNVFVWVMDLGFAAHHVKEHNRKARRYTKTMEEAERQFLDSL